MFEDSLLESGGRLKPNRDWATLASMRRAVDSRTRRPFPQLSETGPHLAAKPAHWRVRATSCVQRPPAAAFAFEVLFTFGYRWRDETIG